MTNFRMDPAGMKKLEAEMTKKLARYRKEAEKTADRKSIPADKVQAYVKVFKDHGVQLGRDNVEKIRRQYGA